jgi:hypothetical protein
VCSYVQIHICAGSIHKRLEGTPHPSRRHQFVAEESIHNLVYLSIAVTSSSGPGLCGVSGEGVFRGIGLRLCRILDMNFRQFIFHALR